MVAAVLVITMLAVNACGASTLKERSKPTMTLDQARKQIDSYQTDIQANLPMKPVSSPASFSDLECDANDIGPHGRKQTWRSATFEDLPLSGRTQAADAFRTYLTGQGFQPVEEPGVHVGWVKMKSLKDDFVAILDGASDASRTFQLEVISPCLWPNGTPPA
ncbi:hypothetical protein [Streptomyces sp. FH025]|uniref:hypothetical protein n=1 Tax=Streptomyces sp. FH025 TaxID=2815937 RepID=UPI001A9D4121|nr:hypothetical protein [Streptomyces sp. FH025]MBO1417657.1 hypothetical protein [Streptomyces sp. FH025]